MRRILNSLVRYLAEVSASEGGELLSARRKAQLLGTPGRTRQTEAAAKPARAGQQTPWRQPSQVERKAMISFSTSSSSSIGFRQ